MEGDKYYHGDRDSDSDRWTRKERPCDPGSCKACLYCQTINNDRDFWCHEKGHTVNGDPCSDYKGDE